MKAGQSAIPDYLYLFCSRLARGTKHLKNKEYPDLFFFCFVNSGSDVSRIDGDSSSHRSSESLLRLQGNSWSA
ncbi:hypothetical protein MESS2_330002 [Mesorhizobium metallidurans STM 2683]|uniref:Uncharacterized protein n=1 Tax=Mesorhizobium metallidurans STM 2683 TaxID=1297569 RepID=M5ER23_9HYPH|nr:hypothetical protein MESS2_330002 [Mesorhizobium metallidurans STM 2683]